MYTYNISYYGYPLDNTFLNSVSSEGMNSFEQAQEQEEGWICSAYHGSADSMPKWIGLRADVIGRVDAENHCRLSNYASTPSPELRQKMENDFQQIWKQVPEVMKLELEKIFGKPDFWIVEVSS